VLNHEAIHVAQSCAAGGLRSVPRTLGLSQEVPTELKIHLDDPLYAGASDWEKALEREAYANQRRLAMGTTLIRTHCRLRATGCLLLALFLVSWPVVATTQCAAGFDEWRQFFNTADVAAFRDGHELSHRWNISYLGQVLGYPSLSVGLAMLVVLTHLDAPACGLAAVKRFLSHGIFRVLAPWTFMVYIVHEPLYILYSALTTANLRPYNPCSNMVERLGFLALMFVIAGPLHVVFERPWGRLVIAKLETPARGRIEGWAHVPGAEKTEAVAMGLRCVDVSAVVENDDGDQPPTSKQKLARAG